MRVLEIFGEPIANGGQESFVISVCKAIEPKVMNIDLLTPYECVNDHYRAIIEARNGTVYTLGLPFRPGGDRSNLLMPLNGFLKQHKYDVVHIHSGSISVLMFASLVARVNGVSKIIVHSHCTGQRKTLRYRLIKALSIPVMAVCPTHYCACSQLAGEWKFSHRIVAEKLQVIENGIDLDRFTYSEQARIDIRVQYGISQDAFVIGNVGRFSEQKNHRFLIEVFEQVYHKDQNAILLLVGDGELKNEIENLLLKKGLSDAVIFTGTTNQVEAYFSAMDIFVMPSFFEGLPIVGVEAQAEGLPVLVSEYVSQALKLSDSVRYLPLERDVDPWVTTIFQLRGEGRAENSTMLRQQGYDIKDTAKVIQRLYCGDISGKN